MGDKLRSSFSCSGCFVWLLSAVLFYVLLHNAYAWASLYRAGVQAEELARELGYTPDRLVYSDVDELGPGIVIGPTRCWAALAYATPLELAPFRERLLQVKPDIIPNGPMAYATYWLLRGADGHVEYFAGSDIPEFYTRIQPQHSYFVRVDIEAGAFPPWVWC